ncbi:MAG: DUF4340 domain-containing protein [Acidobacteriaceae bacterium]|nr:DUF4340 domain-containing protein [Acidobacteriaceae bacterium]
MKPRNLLIAAIVLVILCGAVWWSRKHPQASPTGSSATTSPKLVDVPEAQVQSLDLTKKGGTSLDLQRQNGKWAITSPEALPADQDAVTSMLSSLSPVTADSVVEANPKDIGQYGLNSPSLTVAIHEKSGKTDTLLFGDDVPAGSLVYARLNADPKVYVVSSSVKSSFDKSPNDLRDKRLLTFDSNSLTRIELVSANEDIEFGKNNRNEWQIVKPQPCRADNFQVEELLRKLTDAKMDLSGSAEDQKKADASFASGQRVATVKVTDGSGTQTLEVQKNKDDYYAKSSVVKGDYKLSSDLGKELEKPLDDFRNKKIFDFGFSDPNRIEIQQGSSGKTLVRSGTDWKLNGKTMDSGSVQALIDKLRDLSAAKFVPSGFTTPALTIGVTSDDGKRVEKAEFAKVGDSYIARRVNDAAVYQLDVKSINDILVTNNAIKPAASGKK